MAEGRRILGIDPGVAILGWGILDVVQNNHKLVDYGVVRTESVITIPNRLAEQYDRLLEIIDQYSPKILSIEKLFFFKNSKTIISVGEARGVAMLAGFQKGLEIYEYTPLEIKQAVTGYGRADKAQMQKMIKVLLNLKSIPKPDDAADAIAAAYAHSVFL